METIGEVLDRIIATARALGVELEEEEEKADL